MFVIFISRETLRQKFTETAQALCKLNRLKSKMLLHNPQVVELFQQM